MSQHHIQRFFYCQNFSEFCRIHLKFSLPFQIYAEPQHKLLFRVVRGGGGDFWAPFWFCLCMYLSIVWKIQIFWKCQNFVSPSRDKNWEIFLSTYSTREAFFIRSINFESAGILSLALVNKNWETFLYTREAFFY